MHASPRSTPFPPLDQLLGGGHAPGHSVLLLDRTPQQRSVPLLVGLAAALADAQVPVLYIHDAGAILDRRAELLALRARGVHLVDGTPAEVVDFADKVAAEVILVEALYALGPADDHTRAAHAHRTLFREAAGLPARPATWLLTTRPPRDTLQAVDTSVAVLPGATPDDLTLEILRSRYGPHRRVDLALARCGSHVRLRFPTPACDAA